MVCEVLQVENASYLGPAFSDFAGWPGVPANWLGTGYIDWGNAIGDYVTWQVESGAFAQCSLSFRYAFKVGHGDCPKQLFVNDQVVQTVSFPGTAWMPRGTLDSRTAEAPTLGPAAAPVAAPQGCLCAPRHNYRSVHKWFGLTYQAARRTRRRSTRRQSFLLAVRQSDACHLLSLAAGGGGSQGE